LLVWGEDDRVIPFACHKPFKRAIAQARLLALPNTGHALPIERADALSPRIAEFIQGARE
jgi:pimeloyl-ACP methyl ester carboxylesterase